MDEEMNWDGDTLVLAPACHPWPIWRGFLLAFGLFVLSGMGDIGMVLALRPAAVAIFLATLVAAYRQPRATEGVRAQPTALITDRGHIPWSDCDGLQLVLDEHGAGRLVLRKPYLELVRWRRGETTLESMRTTAQAVASVSGLSLEEHRADSGVVEIGRELDLDDVRLFVSGGPSKSLGMTTSYSEANPIIVSPRGLRVGTRFERWKDIDDIRLEVREDTVLVGNRSGTVLAGFVSVELRDGHWVILQRTVDVTATTPPSPTRRLCDQRELEALVAELRQLRTMASTPTAGGVEDVPKALAEMLSKQKTSANDVR